MTIRRTDMKQASLLADTNLVQAPFVKITLGGLTFGVYKSKVSGTKLSNSVWEELAVQYPNYVQSLDVVKINGTVNKYTLSIDYPITQDDDPNFFEKLFSKVGYSKIYFSYGDFMVPNYIYEEEEAIITDVKENINVNQSKITYTVSAISNTYLSLSGSYTFKARTAKPSDVIKEVLYNSNYKLTTVFKGMASRLNVESYGWIASDDAVVSIPTCVNTSVLEYISFLVSYMKPIGSSGLVNSNYYSMATFEDTNNSYGGSYFKVMRVQKSSSVLNQLCTYIVDIGYPSANVVSDFSVKNSNNWSIIYDYNRELETTPYLRRIDNKGNIEDVYSPLISNKKHLDVRQNDSSWWTKVTQHPISASITIQGLLRPVVLMQYVKLNVWLGNSKHITSGYYLINSQKDSINTTGYKTTLELIKIAADEELQ